MQPVQKYAAVCVLLFDLDVDMVERGQARSADFPPPHAEGKERGRLVHPFMVVLHGSDGSRAAFFYGV